MSSHFKWYPSNEEVVVPWNARYSFPSQANKSVKVTPRIPPKNGSQFAPGQTIRVEFPAQGYVNPINTTFEFDVTLNSSGTSVNEIVRFQNNIQSIFNRVRILYGATPLEDIINYNQIVRNLTEWTSTNQHFSMDQTSIAEGIGGVCMGTNDNTPNETHPINVRQRYIHGVDTVATGGYKEVPNGQPGDAASSPGAEVATRRYQVNLATGLLTQDKLLPVKFMASQLAVEITLEQAAACIFVESFGTSSGTDPTYAVTNFHMIPEILEFDASYGNFLFFDSFFNPFFIDAMFLKGLQDGGVPIKFSSWHTFQFTTGGASSLNLQVQERSRSVKALFAIQNRTPVSFTSDSHATLYDSSTYNPATGTTLQEYQWRIGGRYFPASPVQCSLGSGSGITNGAAEAFVELQKALNIVGDYRLSSSVNTTRWGVARSTADEDLDQDYKSNLNQYASRGNMSVVPPLGDRAAGHLGSVCYASAIDLETSNGVEISGLNAEEQSDISFIAKWAAPQQSGYSMTVFSYYDAMLILRENNVLELIQ